MYSLEKDDDNINLKSLEDLIKEEQKRLEEDTLRLHRNIENIKKRRSDGNHNQPFNNVALSEDKPNNRLPVALPVNEHTKDKYLPGGKLIGFMVKNSREEEINKLINEISKPKEQQYLNNKQSRRSYPQARSNISQCFSVNVREREKENLSEKFASSEYPLIKPSGREIAKNLHSSITFNEGKPNNLIHDLDKRVAVHNTSHVFHYNVGEKNVIDDDREEYLRAKYNHPRIDISHYEENKGDKDIGDHKMVRIGEFSPLNPNVPGGATVLGLGDWDERRQFLLEKYKQDHKMVRIGEFSPLNPNVPGGATVLGLGDWDERRQFLLEKYKQDLSDDWSPNISLEKSKQQAPLSPENTLDVHNCGFSVSPLPKGLENMTEKEVKEYIYRLELQKQIEEKNKLKEEIKRKEAEEEAKIEAKLQRDLEKMRRQCEEEERKKLELAIRRIEHEDYFRERLAIENQKALQENKTSKKKPGKSSALKSHSHKQFEKSTQSDVKGPADGNLTRIPYSRSMPERSAASAISNVHNELRQPLLQEPSNLLATEGLQVLPTNTSKSPPISVRRSKEVDILAQKAIFDAHLKTSPRINIGPSFPPDTIRDRLKEVDNMLKQPLLPESERVLPPVSQPLIHATIPPLSASLQMSKESITAPNRTNYAIFEDKWKVPHVKNDSENAQTKHNNARILTQLGTFRRQLQEESLRMRQRVREDSP